MAQSERDEVERWNVVRDLVKEQGDKTVLAMAVLMLVDQVERCAEGIESLVRAHETSRVDTAEWARGVEREMRNLLGIPPRIEPS